MITILFFDLDGTLCESTKSQHFQFLNQAILEINPKYVISDLDHKTIYDGLSTKQKLERLSELTGLPTNLHNKIYNRKQELTEQLIGKTIKFDKVLFDTLFRLKGDGFRLGVVTNSIKKTTEIILDKLNLTFLLEHITTNEEGLGKPFPDLYNLAVKKFGVNKSEVLAIEDGQHGREAAFKAGVSCLFVKNSNEVNYSNIINFIDLIKKNS